MKRRFIFSISICLFLCLFVSNLPSQELVLKDRQLLIALGNSITEQGERPDGYVSIMRKFLEVLYPERTIYLVNAGIGGHKSTDMLNRFERDVLQYKPDWVTISVGVNDVWHEFLKEQLHRNDLSGVPLAQFKEKLTAMVTSAQSAGAKVALFTTTIIKENLSGPENQKLVAYNKAIRMIARDHHCLLADMDQAFREALSPHQKIGMSDRGILTDDGVHMLPSGNWLMAMTALQAFGCPAERIAAIKPRIERLIADDQKILDANLARYAECNFEVGLPRQNEKRVVFFGSSSVDGWNLPKDFPTIPFLNRGIGGETSRQMVMRFQQDVLNVKPSAAIIFLGSCNDFWEAHKMSTADTKSNIIDMARLADRQGIKLAFGAISPVNDYLPGKDYVSSHPVQKVRELNQWIQDFCQKNKYAFIDFYSAVADSNGKLTSEFTDDGMHCNSTGYARWKPVVIQALQELEVWQQ